MSASRPRGVPPLAAEDHVCTVCSISYRDVCVEDALADLKAMPGRLVEAVDAIPAAVRHRRPDATTWSVAEYVCHLRDVLVATTVRLYRTRTEHEPALEPVFNDLRAARFNYNGRNLQAVLEELADDARGCAQEAARFSPDDWDRRAHRLPEEVRTARWLVRQAMHEGVHHLRDIADVARRVTAGEDGE